MGNIGVVGAGIMGGGVAHINALAGYKVILINVDTIKYGLLFIELGVLHMLFFKEVKKKFNVNIPITYV
ncbi:MULTISPECIES: 3-hydroxyacyl-CoA dehydrogenase NAD-binding domain-containing protein [Bacillus]|uniref:3-hydroxyacyl-CoA dehydrogenase NAD-binding domain-containing protein n=1 Tax=Bacillus TaxID=1386 RepID=UPI000B537FE0|nr:MULTISPECIES: 3-hydroxyacyl-CoA dehydrogenase NAD-binding domain-containing protein [Bacillus]MBP3967428.1 hypothetical protein [Bacillus sp. WL1]MCU5095546.1 3-hydroxyacyl-CoA dehydrogenase NAD-binding domain-containing protein [Bacillus wiedmannii]MDD0821153.1 3-hydroxyacyl-CoA dehydrogenase NAD-binding domain-containing protein [Bacillus cereus]OWW11048.1 hypothetical protein BUE63_06035 [Bacillus sp. MB353a]